MDCKAEPNHELNELPLYSPSSTLVEVEPPRSKRTSPLNRSYSKFRDFLKYVGLQLPEVLIGSSFAWQCPKEHRKVATYHSRGMAALNSLLHLVPTSAAIILLYLFWSMKWTGSPSDNATTLQFVAKLHELLMQSSLVAILLHVIRSQALDGYIPLGALSGAVKGPQLSYLWSLDFVSAMKSPNFCVRRKVAFALSTLGLLFMTTVVGPSSAVLMIPRPDMPYVQLRETRYTKIPELEMFPSNLNYTHALNFSATNNIQRSLGIFAEIKSYSDSLIWPDKYDLLRSAEISLVDEIAAENFSQSTATIPTVLSGRQLGKLLRLSGGGSHGMRLDMKANTTLAISTLQPVTLATCTLFSDEKSDIQYLLHNGTRRFISTGVDMYERMYKSNESFVHTKNQSIVYVDSAPSVTTRTWVPPLWMPSPDDPASLIGVFLYMEFLMNKTTINFQTCTVTPYWRRTKTWIKPGIKDGLETDPATTEEFLKHNDFRPITIATEGIAAINSAEWASELAGPSSVQISPINIALLFTSAISEVPGHMYEEDPDWASPYPCCDGPLLEGYSGSEPSKESRGGLFEFTVTSYGYGYGATDMTIRLSVAVITAYCIITLLYVIYTIATGHTSAAWDSATELILLALQSKEPKDLGHVSVGIKSMETFRKGVGIRVSTVKDDETGEKMEKLELVFDNEETDRRELTKVERDKAY